jgi:hypothetical protein
MIGGAVAAGSAAPDDAAAGDAVAGEAVAGSAAADSAAAGNTVSAGGSAADGAGQQDGEPVETKRPAARRRRRPATAVRVPDGPAENGAAGAEVTPAGDQETREAPAAAI